MPIGHRMAEGGPDSGLERPDFRRRGDNELSASTVNPADSFDSQNRSAYDRLVNALANNPVVAVIGAGLSMPLGYPSWERLIGALKERACAARPADSARFVQLANGDDKLVAAGHFKQALGAAGFAIALQELFGPRSPQFTEVHTALVSLPFRHFVTTNYDASVETAFTATFGKPLPTVHLEVFDESLPLLDRLAGSSREPCCLHLHGSCARPHDVVLTLEDYNRLYISGDRAKRILDTLFAIHTVVFVGFSMSDADLMGRFRDLASFLGQGEPRHFAIVEIPPESHVDARRAVLRERYRVETVFYDPKNEHKELETLVRQLVIDVAQKQRRQQDVTLVELLDRALIGLVKDSPDDAQRRHRIAVVAEQLRDSFSLPSVASIPGDGGHIDAEIDSVFKFTEEGLPGAAVARYEEILGRPGLTNRLKYRLHANIGNALYASDKSEEAARAYLTAISFHKDSKDARGLEVFAHFLLGDDARAQELASALCRDEPEFGRAHSLRIRTLPQEVPFAMAEGSIPEPARSNAEVAVALAELARRQGLTEVEEKYLRLAVSEEPKWPDALGSLAAMLLLSAKETSELDADEGYRPTHPERIVEAELLLTKAIAATPQTDTRRRLAGLHLNRAVARRMLGQHSGSRQDAAEAYRRDPQCSEIALAEALRREEEGDIDGAIQCLETLSTEKDPLRQTLMLALHLAERDKPGDSKRSLDLLAPLWTRVDNIHPVGFRNDVYQLSVRLLAKENRITDARALIDSIPTGVVSDVSRKVLQCRVAITEDKPDLARSLIQEASTLCTPRTSWFERRQIALLAQELKLWDVAYGIWKSIVKATRFGSDARHLLRAAHFAADERFILDFCEQLRKSGIRERECLNLEADILVRHREPDRAITLLQAWLAETPDDLEVRLSLSVVSRQAGRHELAEDDASRLPSVESIESVARGAAAVYVLRHGKKPEQGLWYAYELWRQYPDEMVSRQALVVAIFNPKAPPLELQRPVVASVGTAVQIQQEGESPHWIIIEPGSNPSPTRGEYSPDHPLSGSLMGCSVGQDFVFGGRRHRVIRLENRFVFRANDCLESFEVLFPDDSPFRRFKAPLDVAPGTDPREALGEVWPELEKQERERKRLEGLHQSQLVSLPAVATRLGHPVFDTVRYFALTPELTLHCSGDTPTEWARAAQSLVVGGQVVLDATAVATLFLLDLDDKLKDIPCKMVLPRSVLEELRSMIADAANAHEPHGFIGSFNGQPFLREVSVEQLAAHVKRLERLVEALKASCEIVGGTALLSLPVELRNRLLRVLGTGTADALAIAKERSIPVWTDDWGTAITAHQRLATARVWICPVLHLLHTQGKLSWEELADVNGRLLALGYSFIGLTAPEVVYLMRRSRWNVEVGVGHAVFTHVVRWGLANPSNSLVCGLTLVGIWAECDNEAIASEIICKMLQLMGRQRSGPLIARRLYRCRSRLWDMDHGKARRFRNLLRRWRSRQAVG